MPPPRGTIAMLSAAAMATIAAVSSAVSGNAIASGAMPGCQKMSFA